MLTPADRAELRRHLISTERWLEEALLRAGIGPSIAASVAVSYIDGTVRELELLVSIADCVQPPGTEAPAS
jgi:hypothetical protein